MARQDTRQKILDTAEVLFAEQGFNDTSLRQITRMAGVNLASVSYHFGSRKDLIKAVMDRYLSRFMPALDDALQRLLPRPDIALEQVFESFVAPLMGLSRLRRRGPEIFLQLLASGYMDNQGFLRWFIINHYGGVVVHFTQCVRRAAPELGPAELFWRLHFTLGTVVFTMASGEALRDIARNDFNEHIDVEGLVRRVIPYLASGMKAGTSHDGRPAEEG
ncbi:MULTISPECIES: TetR/AcrR family transcriptional regulator [Oceanimonas]|uniref:TetR family transcriptional regulator n=1 Tax=Oceanimonas doudoroffii TaxID=84158 RepID=A0A233RHD9_9GAMM|nr:TetR/AcrR family transcriptional regulator [Oceanimonas doudoroffii]NHI00605.1 HTH-type transcriptional regulator SrpR [Oceanimonas sp. MB9]OXY82797.1 TetR family transcriptional regulator [Oceanimonas doudoroffii]